MCECRRLRPTSARGHPVEASARPAGRPAEYPAAARRGYPAAARRSRLVPLPGAAACLAAADVRTCVQQLQPTCRPHLDHVLSRFFHSWERRLASVTKDRSVRPFEWGEEWIPAAPAGQAGLHRWIDEVMRD